MRDRALRVGQIGKPNAVDLHVGFRVRLRRTSLGMTQEALAELLGLAFQQVQKYESGANRVSASRLYEMSRVLDVPVSFFFEGFETEPAGRPATAANEPNGTAPSSAAFPVLKRETLELVRAYMRIGDLTLRRYVQELITAVARDVASEKTVVSANDPPARAPADHPPVDHASLDHAPLDHAGDDGDGHS